MGMCHYQEPCLGVLSNSCIKPLLITCSTLLPVCLIDCFGAVASGNGDPEAR